MAQSRHMDALDAGLEVNRWLDRVASGLPCEGDRHIELHRFDRGDGSVTTVWHDNVPVGVAVQVRDALNCTVLTLWERDPRNPEAGSPAGRVGDMDPALALLVRPDGDGDWSVSIGSVGGLPETLEGGGEATVEFCTAAGGGRSPRVRAALRELRDAILAENRDSPGQAARMR